MGQLKSSSAPERVHATTPGTAATAASQAGRLIPHTAMAASRPEPVVATRAKVIPHEVCDPAGLFDVDEVAAVLEQQQSRSGRQEGLQPGLAGTLVTDATLDRTGPSVLS